MTGQDLDPDFDAAATTAGGATLRPDHHPQRFLTLPQVAQELNVSLAQTRALVRGGDLVGVQIGGRGQWRVERNRLEDYITRLYSEHTSAPHRAVTKPSAMLTCYHDRN